MGPVKRSRGGFDKKEVPQEHAAVDAMKKAVDGNGKIGSVVGTANPIGGVLGPDGKPVSTPGMMAPNGQPGQQLPPGAFPGQFPNMFPAGHNPFAGRQRPVFPGPMLRGDWTCPGCGDHVFAKNYACRVCNTPR